MEVNNSDIYEHIVDIDDMMELKLKIPKHLNALQLKALMFKADKLFKISEITIASSNNKLLRDETNLVKKLRSTGIGKGIFSNEMIQDLIIMYKNKVKVLQIIKQLNDKYGVTFTKKQIWQKIWYLKKTNIITSDINLQSQQESTLKK